MSLRPVKTREYVADELAVSLEGVFELEELRSSDPPHSRDLTGVGHDRSGRDGGCPPVDDENAVVGIALPDLSDRRHIDSEFLPHLSDDRLFLCFACLDTSARWPPVARCACLRPTLDDEESVVAAENRDNCLGPTHTAHCTDSRPARA